MTTSLLFELVALPLVVLSLSEVAVAIYYLIWFGFFFVLGGVFYKCILYIVIIVCVFYFAALTCCYKNSFIFKV